MKQISPLTYEWSRYNPRSQSDFNAHFVQSAAGAPGVLIDPLPFNEGDEAHVRSLGGVTAVVLTTAQHDRDAARCAATFECPLLVPRAALPALIEAGLSGAQPYRPEEELPAGLLAVPVPDGPSPGETALYSRAGGGTLIVGDAVLGKPLGELSLLPKDWYDDIIKSARGLRALLARRVSHLLVAHGQSILRDPAPLLQDLIYRHDPRAFLIKREELCWNPGRLQGSRFGSHVADYSRPLGLNVLDFALTSLPPGRQNFPLHRHDGEEEVFIITSGRGEVRTEQGTWPIEAGDVLAFPPRYQIAHAIANTGTEDLIFLALSAPAETLEMIDYPESGARMERTTYGKYRRFRLPQELDLDYWDGERVD
ncbi:MAG: cupin domain-containing protein [Chloroflexota bacterium]|nr:cupin domain-containing protein [Chloroflexota bacterium]